MHTRDDNGAGWMQVSSSHPHPCNKNLSSSPSLSPNPAGIQFLPYSHPHWITCILV